MLQKIMEILLFLAGTYVLMGVGLATPFIADWLMFHPPPPSYQKSDHIVMLKTKGGASISALELPNSDAKYTILASHGNAEDIGYFHWVYQELHEHGFSILAYEYPGYGLSTGHPSKKGSYDAGHTAYRYLTESKGIKPENIILMGRSLGGGVATELALHYPVAGLILESTFVSIYRVVTKITLYPFDRYKNLNKIKKVNCPVLVIHGTDDKLIPPWHGEQLFAAANEPKQHLWVEGANHNDLFETDHVAYKNAIKDFAASLP